MTNETLQMLIDTLDGLQADLDTLAGSDTIDDWQEVCARLAMIAREAIRTSGVRPTGV